ncbi:RHS repeat-associated core domain-containing protein [Cellulomonas sp. NPDC058312]|uniref:RHS repeat-associated core domain-containing protein n=1 Tax=Cellulomonas sp. NPDC058312 TaxID=3346441 RepID=UPI0036EDD7AF
MTVALAAWVGRGVVGGACVAALVGVMLVPATPSPAVARARAAGEVLAWARANAAAAVDPGPVPVAPDPQPQAAPGAAGEVAGPVWGSGSVAPEAGGVVSGESVSVAFSGHDLAGPVEVSVTALDDAVTATAGSEQMVVLAPGFDVSAVDASGESVTSFPHDAPGAPVADAEPAARSTSSMPVTGSGDGSTLIGGLPVGRAPHPEAAGFDVVLGESMAGDDGGSVPGVRVEVTLDPAALGGVRPGSVRLVTRESDAGAWVVVPSFLDVSRSVVVGELDHLSQFVVIGGKDVGDPRPRVVLDPDNDRAFANSPGPRVTEVGYNVALANQVAARLTQVCNADVVVTRTTPTPELGRDVRAGMAFAHDPALTVTFGFNGNQGTAWGNIGNGGSEVYSRGGPLDEQARATVLGVLPVYTGRPANPKARANLTYPQYAGLPGAVIHLETLFLDHNFDRPVIDHGFSFVVDGVFTSLGLQLENQGFDCSDPARGGGWPAPPSAAQVAAWMQLGFANYAAYGGDPVNFTTGNLVELEDLFHVTGPGGSDTQVALVYNSADGRVSRFGTSWSSDLTARVQRFADGSVMVVRGDGASYVFAPDGVGGYVADVNTGAALAEAGGGHLVLTVDDGTTWRFDASHPEGVGDVIEKRDPTGAITRFEYAALTDEAMFRPLTAVVLPGEQRITVTSDTRGVVTALGAPDGRTWQLGYDDNLDLRTITGPDGRVRGFDYDDTHRLTTARDAAGEVYLSNVYDGAGRVTSQGDGVGGTRTFAYTPGGVDYTDAAGSVWSYEVDGRGRVTSSTDPLGHTTTLEYGDLNTPTAVIDPDGARTTYGLDARGRTTGVDAPGEGRTSLALDALGRVTQVTEPGTDDHGTLTTTIARDAGGRATEVTHPGGAVEATSYDPAGNPVGFTDAAGGRWTATFDARGNQTSATDPDGATTTFTYDAGNRLLTSTSPSGATTAYGYDAAGRVVTETDPNGAVTTYGYDANDNLASVTDPTGAVTRQVWDTGRRLVEATDPTGAVTRYAYNPEDALVAVTDPAGAVTGYALDAAHRVTAVTDPTGGVWARVLDAAGRVVRETDPGGGESTWEYDPAGRLVAETDPDGVSTGYAYAPGGQLVEVRDSTGATTTLGYDAAGRPVARTGPDGTETVTYDLAGRVVATTDQAGRTTSSEYDAAGRVVAQTDPTGARSTFEYDGDGRLVAVVDADGVREQWTLDPTGHVTATGATGGAQWQYAYDPAGRVLTETDPAGATTTHTYDPAGRLATLTDPTGAVTAFGYDPAGRQTSRTDPAGVVTRYGYDPAGQLTHVVQNATTSATADLAATALTTSETPADRDVTTTYAYTPVGDLAQVTGPTGAVTRYRYTAGGRPASKTDPLGNRTSYRYDDAGRLTRETDPDGRRTSYRYDPAGRVAQVTSTQGRGGAAVVEVGFEYDATGNPIAMTDPTGVTGWTYDATGRQTAQRTTTGTLTTAYTPAGRRAEQTTPDGATQTWAYDTAGRVAEQTTPAGTLAYTYDPTDRVAAITRTNTDGTPGPLSVFGYDPAGRTTAVRHQVTEVATVPVPAPGEVATTCDVCLPGEDYLAGRTLPGTGTTGSGVWDIAIDQTYTPTGHVASRTRIDTGGRALTGTYAYDPLGRLTTGTESVPAAPAIPTAPTTGGETADLPSPSGGPGEPGDDISSPGSPELPGSTDPAPPAAPEPQAPVTQLAFTYDASGNRLTAARTDPDGTTHTQTATHDAANRVLRTTDTNQAPDTTGTANTPAPGTPAAVLGALAPDPASTVTEYRYDNAGNRTRATTTHPDAPLSPDTTARTWTYGPDGRPASVTDLDRTITTTHDGLGRLAATTTTTEFVQHTATATWDDLTQVATTDDTFGTTTYTRDAADHLAAQTTTHPGSTPATGGTGAHDPPTDPSAEPSGSGSGAVLPGGVTAGPVWELTDALGSVIAQATGDTLTQIAWYDPWGTTQTTTAGWDADHGYTSQTTDLTLGLVAFYARTYDPTTATFTTPDRWAGLLTEPGTLHAYAYVLSDPLTVVDILGYWPDWNSIGGWISDHQREIAGAVIGTAVAIALAACIAATAGICAGVAAGMAAAAGAGGAAGLAAVVGIGAASGAAGAAASYAVTGNSGQYSWSGAASATGQGALLGGATGGVGYGITAGLRAAGSRITATHTLVQRANRPTFVADSRGTVIVMSRTRLEQGFRRAGLPSRATASPGVQYQLPDGSSVRVMSPQGRHELRAVYQSPSGQAVSPFTGKPAPRIVGASRAENRANSRSVTHVQLMI